jgi:hypothetical protein
VAALFSPGETMSDNAMISVYPFGDELYAFTEFPVIHRFDPKTLDTLERVSEKMLLCKTKAVQAIVLFMQIIFCLLGVFLFS